MNSEVVAGDAPVMELEHVARVFGAGPQAVHALRDASLTVHEGESVAIMGRSGSGKSTLLNILGLLDDPTSGDYRIRGHNVTSLSAKDHALLRASTFGFVFQAFHLVPYLTVRENVEMGLTYFRRPRASRAALIDRLIDDVGLTHRGHAPISTLSGGEKQRTAIARALAREPSVLLADEPTGNLDEASAADVLALIDKVADRGVAVVMVTHDPTTAARMQRQLTMRDGVLS